MNQSSLKLLYPLNTLWESNFTYNDGIRKVEKVL